jgi:hypothetical protein
MIGLTALQLVIHNQGHFCLNLPDILKINEIFFYYPFYSVLNFMNDIIEITQFVQLAFYLWFQEENMCRLKKKHQTK